MFSPIKIALCADSGSTNTTDTLGGRSCERSVSSWPARRVHCRPVSTAVQQAQRIRSSIQNRARESEREREREGEREGEAASIEPSRAENAAPHQSCESDAVLSPRCPDSVPSTATHLRPQFVRSLPLGEPVTNFLRSHTSPSESQVDVLKSNSRRFLGDALSPLAIGLGDSDSDAPQSPPPKTSRRAVSCSRKRSEISLA